MIYGRMGGVVRLLRMAKPADARLENRKPDKQDRDRCKINREPTDHEREWADDIVCSGGDADYLVVGMTQSEVVDAN